MDLCAERSSPFSAKRGSLQWTTAQNLAPCCGPQRRTRLPAVDQSLEPGFLLWTTAQILAPCCGPQCRTCLSALGYSTCIDPGSLQWEPQCRIVSDLWVTIQNLSPCWGQQFQNLASAVHYCTVQNLNPCCGPQIRTWLPALNHNAEPAHYCGPQYRILSRLWTTVQNLARFSAA